MQLCYIIILLIVVQVLTSPLTVSGGSVPINQQHKIGPDQVKVVATPGQTILAPGQRIISSPANVGVASGLKQGK